MTVDPAFGPYFWGACAAAMMAAVPDSAAWWWRIPARVGIYVIGAAIVANFYTVVLP